MLNGLDILPFGFYHIQKSQIGVNDVQWFKTLSNIHTNGALVEQVMETDKALSAYKSDFLVANLQHWVSNLPKGKFDYN